MDVNGWIVIIELVWMVNAKVLISYFQYEATEQIGR